jgi:hypothetical protein
MFGNDHEVSPVGLCLCWHNSRCSQTLVMAAPTRPLERTAAAGLVNPIDLLIAIHPTDLSEVASEFSLFG